MLLGPLLGHRLFTSTCCHIDPQLFQLVREQDVSPRWHVPLPLSHRGNKTSFIVSGKLPQIKGGRPGVDHVETVAMGAELLVEYLSLGEFVSTNRSSQPPQHQSPGQRSPETHRFSTDWRLQRSIPILPVEQRLVSRLLRTAHIPHRRH